MSQPRMGPERAGAELGDCQERLPEESRWAGKGPGSQRRMSELKHREAWEGSERVGRPAGCNRHEGDCCGRLVWEEILRGGTGRAWIGRRREQVTEGEGGWTGYVEARESREGAGEEVNIERRCSESV